MQFRELSDEINTDNIPVIFWHWEWMQFPDGFVTMYLGPKTEIASLAILSHES